MDGNPDKTARKMNEFAACLGVLESCALDSCVYVGRKESATKTVKKTEPGEKKRFTRWVSGLFGSMAETVAETTGTIINGTEIK